MKSLDNSRESGVPVAPVEPSERTLHGETVIDEFGWMRDHEDPRLLEYLVAEREYFDDYVRGHARLVDDLAAESARVQVRDRPFSWRVGDYEYLVRVPEAGGRHTRYLRRDLRVGGDPEVVLDLAELARGHDFTRIGVFEPSPDGRWLAYSVDHVGYESYQLRFRDLRTGVDVPRTREGTYYTGAWDESSSVFCYVVHDPMMRPYQVLAHDLNAAPDAADRTLWTEEDEHFNTTVRGTRTRDWIVVTNQSRTTTEELLIPSTDVATPPQPAMPREHGRIYFVEHQKTPEQDRMLALVARGAEERRLVGTPTDRLDQQEWSEVRAPEPGTAWQRLDVFASGVLLSGYRDGTTIFQLFGTDGAVHEYSPTSPAGCLIFEGRRDTLRVQLDQRTHYDTDEIVLVEHSLIEPPRHDRVSLATGQRSVLYRTPVEGHSPARYRTEKVFAPSTGGVSIPVTLAYRSDTKPDGSNPGLVFCYGAYERPWEPTFSPDIVGLLNRGFVYAIAHVRGGGELGRQGWIDGSMASTPHSFHDLVAAREHLVKLGWMNPDKVIAHGSCAGGVAIGQAYTECPEKWAGVVAEAPAIDLLNAMLDEKLPLTVNEWEEWGDPRDEDIYRLMRDYVAYENVSDRRRPPLLITAYYNDPRVLVHEPARWTAALRRVDTHGNRILLRTELGDGGHHGPSGAEHVSRAVAELYAFVVDSGAAGGWRPTTPARDDGTSP